MSKSHILLYALSFSFPLCAFRFTLLYVLLRFAHHFFNRRNPFAHFLEAVLAQSHHPFFARRLSQGTCLNLIHYKRLKGLCNHEKFKYTGPPFVAVFVALAAA